LVQPAAEGAPGRLGAAATPTLVPASINLLLPFKRAAKTQDKAMFDQNNTEEKIQTCLCIALNLKVNPLGF